MKIIIDFEGDDKTHKAEFEANGNNANFVTLFVDDKEYMISVDDLSCVITALNQYKENFFREQY